MQPPVITDPRQLYFDALAEIERLRAALADIAHVPARVMKWPDPVDRLLYIAKTAREALSAK